MSIFERFIRFVFGDLIKLAARNDQLFKQLFFDRDRELREFATYIIPEYGIGKNILITGDAGVGKTNFIHRCLKEGGDVDKYHVIVIDYRAIGIKDVPSLLIAFLNSFTEYLEANGVVDHQITVSPSLSMDGIKQAFGNVYHLINSKKFDAATQKTPLMVVCDDFDYIESDLVMVVPLFECLIDSDKVKFVLTARPYLLDIIRFMDDKLRRDILNHSHRIKLKALDCEDVLFARLFAIMEKTHRYNVLRPRLSLDESIIADWLKSNSNITIAPSDRIKFPFSPALSYFINQISDGNIRDMFDITTAIFLSQPHYDRIRAASDECELELSREELIELFFDKVDESFYIENLNKVRSRRGNQGNSLFINVLQAVKEEEHISQRVRKNLKKMGHTDSEIDEALNHLSHRSYRYIVHRTLGVSIDKEKKFPLEKNWIITRKGDYYLEMVKWPEYIGVCGEPGADYRDFVVGEK